MKKNKRDIATKAQFITLLLIGILTVLGVILSGDEPINPWIKLGIQVLFAVYCGTYGYILGWDANKKPSTLKGP